MLTVSINEVNGIAVFEPNGSLSKEDFKSAAKIVDKYIEENNKLNGLIIHSQKFPGWDSFGALISHLKFVKEHHRKIAFAAIATDSVIGDFAEKVASHFLSAKIKHFSFHELDEAKQWIEDQSTGLSDQL